MTELRSSRIGYGISYSQSIVLTISGSEVLMHVSGTFVEVGERYEVYRQLGMRNIES